MNVEMGGSSRIPRNASTGLGTVVSLVVTALGILSENR
jgi:hypothetical protein